VIIIINIRIEKELISLRVLPMVSRRLLKLLQCWAMLNSLKILIILRDVKLLLESPPKFKEISIVLIKTTKASKMLYLSMKKSLSPSPSSLINSSIRKIK
jgi:hypothetical protein